MLRGVRWFGAALPWGNQTRGRGDASRSNGAGATRVSTGPSRSTGPAAWAAAIRAALDDRAGGTRATLSFDEAVALVCEATSWPIGHAWLQTPTGWRSSGAWHASQTAARAGAGPTGVGDRVTALRETSAITDLGSGRGIVAAVLHLESCRFLPGLEGLGSPLRQAHASALGLSGVVGVPVHSTVGGHRKVTGVLEFITAHEIEPDGALAEALLDVANRTRRRPTRKPRPAGAAKAAAPPRSLEMPRSLDIGMPDNLAG